MSSLEVKGFIMMHGGVYPIPTRRSIKEFELTGATLPPRTQLFAPAILGNSYYDPSRI